MNTRLLQEVYNVAKNQQDLDIMFRVASMLPEDTELPPTTEYGYCGSDDLPESIITVEDFLTFIESIKVK